MVREYSEEQGQVQNQLCVSGGQRWGSGGAAAGHRETIALKYTLQHILRLKVCREEFKASYADVETAFENLLRGNKT